MKYFLLKFKLISCPILPEDKLFSSLRMNSFLPWISVKIFGTVSSSDFPRPKNSIFSSFIFHLLTSLFGLVWTPYQFESYCTWVKIKFCQFQFQLVDNSLHMVCIPGTTQNTAWCVLFLLQKKDIVDQCWVCYFQIFFRIITELKVPHPLFAQLIFAEGQYFAVGFN